MDEGTSAPQTGTARHILAGKFPAFTLRPDCEQYACHVQFISMQGWCSALLKRKQKDGDLRANLH